MKKNISLKNIFLISLALCIISCNKDGQPARDVYTGTVFLIGCTTAGIDVNGQTGTGYGTAWKGHSNAISVKNICLLYKTGLSPGDVITFHITQTDVEPTTGECNLMDCLLDSPPNEVYISQIKKL